MLARGTHHLCWILDGWGKKHVVNIIKKYGCREHAGGEFLRGEGDCGKSIPHQIEIKLDPQKYYFPKQFKRFTWLWR